MYTIHGKTLFKGGHPVSSKASPNYGKTIVPEIAVIHFTGDMGTGGLQWLTQKGSGVSAHLWVSRSGIVWQLLPLYEDGRTVRGWHAGVSEWEGRRDVNSFSIGIENQGIGQDWPEAQIQANIDLLICLHQVFPLQATVGHEDVAPGRKVDPGPLYPWDRIADAMIAAGVGK